MGCSFFVTIRLIVSDRNNKIRRYIIMDNKRIITTAMLTEYKQKMIEDEKSGATIDKYMHDVESFVLYCEEENIEDISKAVSISYKDRLITSGRYSARSINAMLAGVNSFFKHMNWCDCVVKGLKIQQDTFRSADRELTREEYEKLLRAARTKGRYRLYMAMQTICATGIRVSELRFITVEAVNDGYAEVILKGKVRRILIPTDLISLLKEYIQKTGRKQGSVFVTRNGRPLDRSNICHEMKALCDEAGVEKSKVFPHNLRHLFACVYYEQDKDISNLADLMGHSNINTTRVYTQISMRRLLELVDGMGLVMMSSWGPVRTKKIEAA